MQERQTTIKIKVAELAEERLQKGPRSTLVRPPSQEAQAVVAAILARELQRGRTVGGR